MKKKQVGRLKKNKHKGKEVGVRGKEEREKGKGGPEKGSSNGSLEGPGYKKPSCP